MNQTIHFPGLSGDIHVTPTDDLREHVLSLSCWCGPKRDDQTPEVVIHNAMDQRERYERGEILPQ